jgi:uncharacterized protein (TIGR03084 family)
MADLEPVLADLTDESAELDAIVAGLADADWATDTPAPGWTIAHQIAHLAWTDDAALLAVTDPAGFADEVQRALARFSSYVEDGAAIGATTAPSELLRRWRTGRTVLADALRDAPAGTRFGWFGPPMSAPSMATARLMETWAHGQDVADALGVTRLPTGRLRNVSHLGVRTRDFAFAVRNLTPPAEEFRIELTAPDGSSWIWGPDDATQRVTGPALDFCLRVTQRRHLDDLALRAEGPDAQTWLEIAQAFAGPSGSGRRPSGVR